MKLKKASYADFERIYSEMERNFIREEIRDRDAALATMSERDYSIYHVLHGETKVGFLTVWELADFAFIEHFVIYEGFRCKGYGAQALAVACKKFSKIVLEVEPARDEMQKRRVSFYKRCGFRENDFDYIQPPYRQGDEGTELILFSYPERLSDCSAVKDQLYRLVYKIKN